MSTSDDGLAQSGDDTDEVLDALPAPDPADPVDKADVIGEGGRWLAAWSGRFLIIAAALFVIGWVMVQLREGIMPLMLALLITSVLWPLTSALKRRGIPYGYGALISVLGGLAVVIGMVMLIAPSVVAQLPVLSNKAVDGMRRLQAWAVGPPLNLRDDQLNQWVHQAIVFLQERSADILSRVLSLGGSVGNGIVTVVLTLVLVFFFLKDGHRFLGFTRTFVGRRAGFHATELLTRLWNTLSGYIRMQALVSLIDAVFIGLGLVLLGVPLAFPLAVITFMAGFIPVVGAITAGALAMLVALVSNSWITALLVLALTLVVQQVEGNILQPMLQSRVMKLHPVIVLMSVLLGGGWFGIVGAFLGVPVTASVAVVLRYLGDLIDLRTGDRSAQDIAWATADGHVVAHESVRQAAFFRDLVRGRSRGMRRSPEETGQAAGDTSRHSLLKRVVDRGRALRRGREATSGERAE